jgi:hypothetical protein
MNDETLSSIQRYHFQPNLIYVIWMVPLKIGLQGTYQFKLETQDSKVIDAELRKIFNFS